MFFCIIDLPTCKITATFKKLSGTCMYHIWTNQLSGNTEIHFVMLIFLQTSIVQAQIIYRRVHFLSVELFLFCNCMTILISTFVVILHYWLNYSRSCAGHSRLLELTRGLVIKTAAVLISIIVMTAQCLRASQDQVRQVKPSCPMPVINSAQAWLISNKPYNSCSIYIGYLANYILFFPVRLHCSCS